MTKLTRFINSLQTKLVASFILLILVIAGGTFFYTFGQTKKALLEITRDDLAQMIGLASTQFSAAEVQQLGQLQPGQEQTPAYLALRDKLRHLRVISPNLVNFYILRIEGNQVIFYVDDVADSPAAIGQVYGEPEPRLFDAVNGLQVSDDLYTDEWGTFLSGYAPIQTAAGKSGFILGVDMEATTVIARQNFIGNTIYLVIGISVLFAGILIGIFSLTIIRDIKALNQVAEKISLGDTNVSVGVRRNDEIGDLAQSFGRMVTSLKIMMAADDETSADDGPSDTNVPPAPQS
jgi:HAMP domain-containing protein